jgi:hypothetical protein
VGWSAKDGGGDRRRGGGAPWAMDYSIGRERGSRGVYGMNRYNGNCVLCNFVGGQIGLKSWMKMYFR